MYWNPFTFVGWTTSGITLSPKNCISVLKGQMCELQSENTSGTLNNPGSLFVSIHITFPSQPNRLQPLIATRSKPSRSFQQKSINVSELFKRSDWGKQKFHSQMDLMEQIQIENNVCNVTYSSSRENGLIAWGDWTKHLESSRTVLTLRQWQRLWQLWHSINIFCCFLQLIIIKECHTGVRT